MDEWGAWNKKLYSKINFETFSNWKGHQLSSAKRSHKTAMEHQRREEARNEPTTEAPVRSLYIQPIYSVGQRPALENRIFSKIRPLAELARQRPELDPWGFSPKEKRLGTFRRLVVSPHICTRNWPIEKNNTIFSRILRTRIFSAHMYEKLTYWKK